MTQTTTEQHLSNTQANTPITAYLLMHEHDLKSLICHADTLLNLDEDKRNTVLTHIQQQALSHNPAQSAASTEKGGFNAWFNIPDDEKFYLEPTPQCNENCVKEHNDKIKAASLQQSLNIVLGIFSPTTKLKLFGSQSLVEGKLLGQGKDAAVYALKGDEEWVIKVLKFGGAEKAELLAHYVNQLAEEAKLKIEPLISLGDGRLIQRFVEGTPVANQLWGKNLLNAQKIASEMTSISKERLGLVNGKEFIQEGKIKLSIDPSFANHLFEESEGSLKYKGNIDPIYTVQDFTRGR